MPVLAPNSVKSADAQNQFGTGSPGATPKNP
jgi:hypothetical protein